MGNTWQTPEGAWSEPNAIRELMRDFQVLPYDMNDSEEWMKCNTYNKLVFTLSRELSDELLSEMYNKSLTAELA